MYIAIDEANCQLLQRNQQLVIKDKANKETLFPIVKVKQVLINQPCLLDSQLVNLCLRNNTEIVLHDSTPVILSDQNNLGANLIRLKQACLALSLRPELTLKIAHKVAYKKWRGQWHTLVALKKLYGITHMDNANAIHKLQLARQYKTDIHAKLLGMEGSLARDYYRALTHIVPSWCHFKKRVKRPPTDPLNALLSLSYSLLTQQIQQLLLSLGYETGIGFLHKPTDYRPSLACDLIEPYRAELDFLAIFLLRTELKPHHFYYLDNGACRLTKEGQARFYPVFHKQNKVRKHNLKRYLVKLRARLLKEER